MDEWGTELLTSSGQSAALFDASLGGAHFRSAVQDQVAKLDHPELTPSARFLADMEQGNLSFAQLSMNLAKQHRQHFEDRPLKPETLAEYRQLAEASLAEQRELEAQEEGSFEDYMRRYYRQYEIGRAT